jgi:AraC family transcriptional regulator
MAERGAYGQRLGSRFRLGHAPALVSRTLRKSEIAVTELRCDSPDQGLTTSIPREDAYLVALQVRQCPDHELWLDGRPVASRPFAAGVTSFYDLRRDPIAYLRSPFHSLMFYLPRKAFDAIADDANAPRIDELRHPPGVGADDPVMRGRGAALLPALENPDQVSRVFVDHVTLAVGAHVAQLYGDMRVVSRPVRGGLAPWQQRRAEEVLAANLDGGVGMKELARECGLSIRHFSRAFRQSTGVAPHQWLLQRRLDAARQLLRDRRLSPCEVALACGFSDQSHFTRVLPIWSAPARAPGGAASNTDAWFPRGGP